MTVGMPRRSTATTVYFLMLLVTLAASVVNLLLIGIEGNPVVALTCVVALLLVIHPNLMHFSRTEMSALLFLAIGLGVIGAVSYNRWLGLTFTPTGAAFALVMLSGYIIARFLLQYRLAYAFSAVGFLVILAPTIYLLATSVSRLNDLFVNGSENYVTSWLIVTSLAMCAARMAEGKPPPLWPVIVTFLISVSQYTRASILVSFLAVVATIYVRLGFKWALVFALTGLVAAIPFGGQIAAAITEAVEATKFGRRGFDTPRWEMWASYLDHLTFASALLGTDTDAIPVISDYGGNPHNSFIRFHAFYGIVPLLIGLWIVGRATIMSKGYIFFPVTLILLRAFSDAMLIGTVLDTFLMIALVAALLSAGASKPLPLGVAGKGDTRSHTSSAEGALLRNRPLEPVYQ